jgi:predicted metalloprotease
VGDDRLQRRAGGQLDPDSFTHGSSGQRTDWFNRGRDGGEPADCDAFSPDSI